MPVALVALGMLVGLRVRTCNVPGEGRLRAAAIGETVLTTATVAAGVSCSSRPIWGASTRLPFWLVALVLGICAAPSAAASLHASAGLANRSCTTRRRHGWTAVDRAGRCCPRAAARAVVTDRRSARPPAGLRRRRRHRARRVAADPRIVVGDRATGLHRRASAAAWRRGRLPVAVGVC